MVRHDLEEELAGLRERYAKLEKLVEALQAGTKPAPAANRRTEPHCVIEPQVTITQMPDRNRSFVMPSDSELRRLHEIVIGRYPRLKVRTQNSNEAIEGFRRAFLRVGHLGRDKLNDNYFLSWWIDNATLWLRDHQVYPCDLSGHDFVAAVLSHGDIDYVPLDRFPYDCSAFGLRGDSTGRPATDGWRTVLATGRLREPVPLPRAHSFA